MYYFYYYDITKSIELVLLTLTFDFDQATLPFLTFACAVFAVVDNKIILFKINTKI